MINGGCCPLTIDYYQLNLMQRIVYSLLLSLVTLLYAEAQTPIRSWLVSMPDSVMPLLTKNDRLDLIDFYEARMRAVVNNRFDGKSSLDTLTENFLRISYTPSADVTMKLLPVNDTTDILCMATTAKAMVNDSRIAFFDMQWQPLDLTFYMHEPRIEDFRSTVQSDSAQLAWNKLDAFFRTYHLCAESTELKCVFTTPDHLSADDRKEVTPYLRREPLTYRWTNGKYESHE